LLFVHNTFEVNASTILQILEIINSYRKLSFFCINNINIVEMIFFA